MQLAEKNILTRCKALVNQYYKEPVDGKIEAVTSTVLNNIDSGKDQEMTANDDESMTADNNN